MKTLSAPAKAQRIGSKTKYVAATEKYLTVLFCCLLFSFQAKSINVQISKVDDACAESIGSISAFVSGGTAPYTYVWSNGVTNISAYDYDTIHNLSAGVYSLTVYDALGDSAVGGATLTNYPNLDRNGLLNAMNMMTNHGPPPNVLSGYACPNQSDGIMFGLLDIVGGIPPFTASSLSVTNFGTGLTNPNAIAYTAVGTNGENYFAVDSLTYADQFSLIITDNAGCSGFFSDYEVGPQFFSTNTVITTPATTGQNNGSMTLSQNQAWFSLNATLRDAGTIVASQQHVLGSMVLSTTLHSGTYQLQLEYDNVRNFCDTTMNIAVTVAANNYFWIGGDGDWSDINHWSNVSGGAPFYGTPPTANDDVFFDAGSPLAGSCIVRFASFPVAECRNISVVGFPTFSDFGSSIEFEISGSADFGNAIFQFTSPVLSSVIRFKSDVATTLIFSPDLGNAAFDFSSANGTGVFNLASDFKSPRVTLYSGTLNTAGYTFHVENFTSDYTAFPRALNLSNSQVIIDDIPLYGANLFRWYCDTILVVNAQNASFSSTASLNAFKMRNTSIGNVTLSNSVSFDFANINIGSLRNIQTFSGNLNIVGSGYLIIDSIISASNSLSNAVINGFDSIEINVFTNNSQPPLNINCASGATGNYCRIGQLTSTNQVAIFADDFSNIVIDSLLASSIWLAQQGSLQNASNIVINNLDCSLSQGINNFNGSIIERSCTIGTFTIPGADQVHIDSAITLNIDTLITTGAFPTPVFLFGNVPSTPSIIHLNKTFCGDYLQVRGINNTGSPFYAGVNSVDAGNNSNIQFTACSISGSVYHPFPDSSATWNFYTSTAMCLPFFGTINMNYSITLSGDTLINSQTYHQLYIPFVSTDTTSCCCTQYVNSGYQGSVRQDIPNRKVFYVPPSDSVEQLLYDFNMQVGDTVKGFLESLWPPDDTVQTIDSVLVGNGYRKRWNINSCYNISLIEGVGSSYGLIQLSYGCITDAPGFTLNCHTQNGTTLYPDTVTYCPLIVGTLSEVWPGDANYDLTVNNLDVLNIGLAYNETGSIRGGATNYYIGQPANDWINFFQTAVNHKHADCNGDGIINDADTVAIALNYGQNHPAHVVNPNPQLLPAPSLYIEINPDSSVLGDTVNVDVYLGTNATPVDSIYGIAFTIGFDTAYIDTSYMTFDYTGAWMGTTGVDLLTFQKTRFLEGAVDMAMVRTDQQNIAGFGFLERIGIVVVDNIGARISTPFTLSNVRAITAAEYELTINTNGDSLSIDSSAHVGVFEIENLQNMISVYPNPAKDKLNIRSGNLKMNVVEIYNSMGEMVLNEKINSNVFALYTNNLEQGFYLIRCITDKGIINKRMVVVGIE